MRSGPFLRKPAVLLALSLAAFAIIVSVIGRLARSPELADRATALPGPMGLAAYPALSPDGKKIAFSARSGSQKDFSLFVQDLPGGQPRRLTGGAGSDTGPAWSPDGSRIAFLRTSGDESTCMTVPAAGGAEQKLAECAAVTEESGRRPLPSIAWTSDGASLVATAPSGEEPPALSLIPLGGGAPKRLTSPPKSISGDSTPTLSADGRKMAFVRSTSQDGGDIYVCDLPACEAKRITFDNRPVRGIAWSADGSDLIYGGDRFVGWRLWRLGAAGGSAREVVVRGRQTQYPAIRASRLVYADGSASSAIWRAPLNVQDADAGAPVIRSREDESSPTWSPDGSRIANISEQSGAPEVWVADASGGNRVQLTRLQRQHRPGRPRWSPDGKTLIFTLRGEGRPQIGSVPASGGEVKRLLEGETPAWSSDGRWIYYQRRSQVWKAAADGSKQTQLTDREGAQPEEGPDGKHVYYKRYRAIWRQPVSGGAEEEVNGPERELIASAPIQVSPKGLYFTEWERTERTPLLIFQAWDTKRRAVVAKLWNGDPASFCVSPDGKSVLYSRTDRDETSLMVIEKFR